MMRTRLALLTALFSLLLTAPSWAATLIAQADGTFVTNTTWALADSTSLLDSQAGSSAVTTAYASNRSSAFTPGAISVDAICLKIASRVAAPVGTLKAELAQAGNPVAGTEVTVNVSDITRDANVGTSTTLPSGLGWICLKFAAPVTLAGATAYTLETKCSTTSEVTLYSDATSKNWSRFLRKSGTTNTPAASDNFYVMKEWTAAGTGTARTVTVDETATTQYGAAVTAHSWGCSQGGTIANGTGPSKNYILRWRGWGVVWPGGTLTIGTVATPVPASSTAEYQMNCVADGDSGLEVMGGTFTVQGVADGRTVTWTKLTANAAANATSLTTSDSTGWKDNDVVSICSTTQTYSQSELGAANGAASGTTLTVDGFAGTAGGLLNAHSGTSPTQATLHESTHNVKVHGVSASLPGYIHCKGTYTVDLDWAEFYNLGDSTVGEKTKGLTLLPCTSSAFSMSYCSLHDCEDNGFYLITTGGVITSAATVTIEYSTFDSLCTAGNQPCISLNESTTNSVSNLTVTFDHNCVIRNINSSSPVLQAPALPTLSITNSVVSGNAGSNGAVAVLAVTSGSTVSVSNNIINSNQSQGLVLNLQETGFSSLPGWPASFTCSTNSIWRNFSVGLRLRTGSMQTITSCTLFGNNGINLTLGQVSGEAASGWVFDGCTLAGDTTFATAVGLDMAIGNFNKPYARFYNCTFGVASGILTTHSTSDISFTGAYCDGTVFLNNCVLGSATEIGTATSIGLLGFVASDKHDQTANTFKRWTRYGIIANDTTTYHTGVGSDTISENLTPNSNSSSAKKLQSGIKRVNVRNGDHPTIGVYIYKSASYNGNQPRLVVKRNDYLGITSDTVLATYSGGTGAWAQISGATASVTADGILEVYVDCDGTAGSINDDDWSKS